MAHGAGGKATQTLIEGLFVPAFASPALAALADAGTVSIGGVDVGADDRQLRRQADHASRAGRSASWPSTGRSTTLPSRGREPLALSLSMVLEEGLPSDVLRGEVDAIARAAEAAGVQVVAGDTKVVERGHADQMYLCTAGVGRGRRRARRCRRRAFVPATASSCRARSATTERRSCSPAASSSSTRPSSPTHCSLWPAVDALLDAAGPQLRCMRDATRGGVASVLNELARASGVAMIVREGDVPVQPAVAGAAEILGIDPMYVANEGKLVAFVAPEAADAALAALRAVPGCEGAVEIGEVKTEPPGMVLVQTAFGGKRVMDQLVGDPLPGSVDQQEGVPMAGTVEFVPGQQKTEQVTAHVLWMTTGLSCEGDSVAMTAATNPSLEDIIQGVIPGMPRVVIHNQVVAYEVGQEYIQAWYDAEQGKLDPFVLIIEGSIGNEEINGEGHWTGFGVNPENGQPITTNEWVDRLANKAAAVVAIGTCATYGGIPAMKNNPTGAMGLPDYLGWKWKSKAGLPVVCIPGCPAQPDNMTETLLYLVLHLGGLAPAPELDDQLRPKWLFGRSVRESCNRAGYTEQGQFATEYGDDPRCLVKLGCKGPVVRCNVPVRGWVNGIGGCPNVGGICMACTMPGFPDKYMPFMEPDSWGQAAANATKFTYGPVLKFFRQRNIKTKFDKEPEWRKPGRQLTTGYQKRW